MNVVHDIQTGVNTVQKVEQTVSAINATVNTEHTVEDDVKQLTPLVEEAVAEVEAVVNEVQTVEDDVKQLMPLVEKTVDEVVYEVQTVVHKTSLFTHVLHKLKSMCCFK